MRWYIYYYLGQSITPIEKENVIIHPEDNIMLSFIQVIAFMLSPSKMILLNIYGNVIIQPNDNTM